MKERSIVPYVVFSHPNRADEWKRIQDKFGTAVQEGDMFLFETSSVIALPALKCSLFHYVQYWALTNAAGEVREVSFNEAPHPFNENIDAVVLVYLEDRCVPANVNFRTTKCPAAVTMSKALAECHDPAWAERSPAHRETLSIQAPWARFHSIITLAPTRIGKQSGRPYRTTQCAIAPTGVVEARLLDAFQRDENSMKALDDVALRFQSRMAEMQAKVAKT